jgi:hypothetical protein
MKKNNITHDIELTIAEEPYIMMMSYAHEFSPNECSGVGLVEKTNTNGDISFHVTRVFLPLQRNRPGTTDIPDSELNRINTELVQEGVDTRLHRFHWHSHVDMDVFHSYTDEENYDEMRTGEWAVSLVVNKKYKMLASVHIYDPIRINVLNIKVTPPEVDMDIVPEELKKIIKKNAEKVIFWDNEQTKKEEISHKSYGYGWNTNRKHEISSIPSYGIGLEFDTILYNLLIQGEKAGLLELIYDNDLRTIVGYTNNNGTTYELSSYEDYSYYKGGNNGGYIGGF